MKTLLPCLAVSICSAPLLAQNNAVQVITSPRGVMAGNELAFVYDGPASAHTRKSIVRKPAGIPAALSTYAGTGSTAVPEYTDTAINAWLNAQPGVSGMETEMDAVSSGNGFAPLVGYAGPLAPVPTNARLSPAAAEQSWVGIYVSFAAGSLTGTFEENEYYNAYIHGLGAASGSEVLGYVLDGSRTNTRLVGEIYLEHSNASGDFLSGTVPASPTMDMVAMDAAIADVVNGGGAFQPSVAEVSNKLYFSITPNCASLWNGNAALRSVLNGGKNVSASTIFVASFSNGAVDNVDVHLTHEQVAGDSDPGANLDALSVVNYHPNSVATPLYCIVSFEGSGMGAQIQALFPYGSGPSERRPLQNIFGINLDFIFAVATGDIDALCVRDPEGATNIPLTHADAYDDYVTSERMGLSVAREPVGFTTPGSNPTIPLACTVSGWAGGASSTPSYVFLVAQSAAWVPSGPTLPNGGWIGTTLPVVFGPFPRGAGQEVLTAQVTSPPLGGYVVKIQAGSTLLDLTPLADSWPVLIRL